MTESLESSQAFETFSSRSIKGLLAYFMGNTLDPQLSADLAAETFATAFEHRGRFDPRRGTADAWLLGIAHNQLRHMRRRGSIDYRARRRLGIPPLALDDVSIERIDDLLDIEAMKAALWGALEALPGRTADAIRLRVVDELPYEEVARQLGCSQRAARVRVSRGLGQLHKSMEER